MGQYGPARDYFSTDCKSAPSSFLQKVDYAYNIRGWLTNINNIADTADEVTDLFAFKINYNTREQSIPGVENLYNGNISDPSRKGERSEAKRIGAPKATVLRACTAISTTI